MPQFSDDLVYYISLATFGTLVVLFCLALSLAVSRIRWRGTAAAATPPGLEDREPLSLDQFYSQFYEGQAPRMLVAEVVGAFALAAGVPARFLRPEDSFASLGAAARESAQQFAVEAVTLMREAEERAGMSLFSGRFITLDDHIRGQAIAEHFLRVNH